MVSSLLNLLPAVVQPQSPGLGTSYYDFVKKNDQAVVKGALALGTVLCRWRWSCLAGVAVGYGAHERLMDLFKQTSFYWNDTDTFKVVVAFVACMLVNQDAEIAPHALSFGYGLYLGQLLYHFREKKQMS